LPTSASSTPKGTFCSGKRSCWVRPVRPAFCRSGWRSAGASTAGPSVFLKELYGGLRKKCIKFRSYVIAKSKSGDWEELARKFDWHCADLDEFKKGVATKSQYLDHAAKPILDQIVHLSQRVENILHDLDVFITAVDRSVEILLNNKDVEEVDTLDNEEVIIEQEAAWLLHRWIETTEDVKRIKGQIATLQENFDDFAFDHAMSQAMRHVKDKDA